MTTIVLATGNPGKVRELRAIFAAAATGAVEVIGLADVPGGPWTEPEEHGKTFAENARIKALSYATQIGAKQLLCLADDSGIEIDALKLEGGTPRPGVISSHYCTDGEERGMSREERDAANNARVLRELASTPDLQRTARFVCCMYLARAEREGESFKHAILHETRGTVEGRIGIPPSVPRGTNGFGYDPLFLVGPQFTRTMSELDPAEKNGLSHRGRAGRAMAEWVVRNSTSVSNQRA